MLLPHWLRLAASRAACTAGSKSAIRTAMIAITTSSSIRVKPRHRNRDLVSMRKISRGWNASGHPPDPGDDPAGAGVVGVAEPRAQPRLLARDAEGSHGGEGRAPANRAA